MKITLERLVKTGALLYGKMQNCYHPRSVYIPHGKNKNASGVPVNDCIAEYKKWLVDVREYFAKKKVALPFELFDASAVDQRYNEQNNSLENLQELTENLSAQITYIEKSASPQQSDNKSLFYTFTLHKDGRLTRAVNGGQEYAMETSSLRYRFMKALGKHSQIYFKKTSRWAKECDASTRQIGACVEGIRKQVDKRFEIKGKDFIDSKNDSGYRLGNLIKINVL